MTTDQPSVSFLCTAYRTEDTLEETLDSVLRQTRDDWELVVCDNGRSDSIAALVEPYLEDPRVSMVRQENQFAAGGVNAAGRVARGRYVAVLHTDDLVLPTFVERLVPLLDDDPDTHALSPDALYLDARGVRPDTLRGPVPARYRSGGPVTLLELLEQWLPYYTALVRREAWEAIGGFRRDARNVEDLTLWLDLITHGYVVRCHDEPLAVYRLDEGSDSRSAFGTEVTQESWERVMSEAVESHGTAEEKAALVDALSWSRHLRFTKRARRLLLEGDFAGAREAARAARREKSDLRTRLTLVALSTWPWALLATYRAKKALERLLGRLARRRSIEGQEA